MAPSVAIRVLFGDGIHELWFGLRMFSVLTMTSTAVRKRKSGQQPGHDRLRAITWESSAVLLYHSGSLDTASLDTACLPHHLDCRYGRKYIGKIIRQTKMLTVVRPKKSREGYIGGIIVGGLGGWGLASLWHIASAAVLPMHGLILGIAISIIAPLGDFGESMIKRQFNVKDSSNLLPGHGGFFDRIDSSLWAAMLGYYLILIIR